MTQGREVSMVQKNTIELQRQVLCQEGEKSGMQAEEGALSQSFRPKFVGGDQLECCESCTDQEIHASSEGDSGTSWISCTDMNEPKHGIGKEGKACESPQRNPVASDTFCAQARQVSHVALPASGRITLSDKSTTDYKSLGVVGQPLKGLAQRVKCTLVIDRARFLRENLAGLRC